jgi:hypothetical protein
VTANAHISSLEAELKASRKAWDVATAAKATAEKATKSALAKVKKAEKALFDANKEHLQREQAVTERLHKMSAVAGGTYYAFLFLLLSCPLFVLADVCLFCHLCFLGCAERIGVSSSSLEPEDDFPMAAVNLLEVNWISVQEIFELVSCVLTRIFVGLWPKQRAEMPDNDLKKLAKAFDTPDDPILLMKGRSMKRGAEGAIALTYAHGEEVNWEKVSSSLGRPLSELKVFFEKAKRYALGIVLMISPSVASATSAMPVSLTPVTSGSVPPPNAGATSATPTYAADPEAEVA